MSGPTQNEPAEGARNDDASPKTAKGAGQGVSAEQPAEGADDASAGDADAAAKRAS